MVVVSACITIRSGRYNKALDLITLSRESRLSPSLPFSNLITRQYQAKTGRRSMSVCCEVSLVNLRKVSLEGRGRRKISLKATTLRRTIWVSVVLQSLVIAFSSSILSRSRLGRWNARASRDVSAVVETNKSSSVLSPLSSGASSASFWSSVSSFAPYTFHRLQLVLDALGTLAGGNTLARYALAGSDASRRRALGC